LRFGDFVSIGVYILLGVEIQPNISYVALAYPNLHDDFFPFARAVPMDTNDFPQKVHFFFFG